MNIFNFYKLISPYIVKFIYWMGMVCFIIVGFDCYNDNAHILRRCIDNSWCNFCLVSKLPLMARDL